MPAKIYHCDLFGKRKEKYDFLSSNSVSTVSWTELNPDPKYHFFVPKDFSMQTEWEKGIKVSELFEEYNTGIQTKKDRLSINFNIEELQNKLKFFKENEIETIRQYFNLGKDGRDWTVKEAKNDIMNSKYIISDIFYRPFDYRKTYYSGKTKGFIAYPRRETSKHMLKNNVCLITLRINGELDEFVSIIANTLVEKGSLAKGNYSFFPLYLYPENGGENVEEALSFHDGENEKHNGGIKSPLQPRPNFNPEIIKQIEQKLGMTLDWQAGIGESNVETITDGQFVKNSQTLENSDPRSPLQFTPTDLLDYIYAVLHSPTYREKYKEFLKIDFPRVPFGLSNGVDSNGDTVVASTSFWNLVKLGKKLRKLHLMEGINPLELEQGELSGEGENLVENIKYQNGKVWINETKYFDNVPEIAWNFYIGGYQPAQKWLKDRKGRQLTFDDIMHYQKIIYVLGETEKVMGEIDMN
jgi:predicted helicase